MFSFFCGIDVSKNSFHATLVNSNGEILFSSQFPMSSQGFKTFLNSLKFKCLYPSKLLIAMESSGSYYINLLSFIHSNNLHCILLNPLLISNFSRLSLRKTKTDRKDSSIIAEFLRIHANRLPQQKQSSQNLRILARERQRISEEIASLKNEIKRLIHILFPELLSFINPFTLSSLHLLLSFPSKNAFLNASRKEILKILYSPKKGRKSSFPISEILETAKNSIGITSSLYEEILKSKIRRLLALQKELKRVESLFLSQCKISYSKQLEILKSIKGVKDITASHFIAEIIDIKRFSSAKKLIAYAGVDPSVYESGQFKGKGRISKRGNRSLRRVLYLMAVSVVRVNEVFREYFLKKRAQGKSYKQAIMAVIHKLLRIIYVLFTRQVLFNPSYHSL